MAIKALATAVAMVNGASFDRIRHGFSSLGHFVISPGFF
jgi:hypothetical protein